MTRTGLALLVLLLGCKSSDKQGDCDKLFAASNAAAEHANASPMIEGTPDQIASTAAANVTAFAESKKMLTDVELKDKTVAGLRDQLAANLDQRIALFQSMVTAGKSNDEAAFNAAKDDEDAADTAEDAIDKQIASYCGR